MAVQSQTRVLGINAIIAKMRNKLATSIAESGQSVIVVYTQNYALHVHERVDITHKVGQAKFLEQPAKQFKSEIWRIVKTAAKAGKTMLQALLLGGLRLQRESQKLVPIDTGALKNSADTRID